MVYLLYRTVCSVYFIVWIVLSGVDMIKYPDVEDQLKWFIFLTNWSFSVLTLDVVLQTVIILFSYNKLVKERKTGNTLRIWM